MIDRRSATLKKEVSPRTRTTRRHQRPASDEESASGRYKGLIESPEDATDSDGRCTDEPIEPPDQSGCEGARWRGKGQGVEHREVTPARRSGQAVTRVHQPSREDA